jgi:hypothetical protein
MSQFWQGAEIRPQNTKGADKILGGRKKLGPKFCQIYRKGAEHIFVACDVASLYVYCITSVSHFQRLWQLAQWLYDRWHIAAVTEAES